MSEDTQMRNEFEEIAVNRAIQAEKERDTLKAELQKYKEDGEYMVTALKRICLGNNGPRRSGMDSDPIAVSRDTLRMWAQEALALHNKLIRESGNASIEESK